MRSEVDPLRTVDRTLARLNGRDGRCNPTSAMCASRLTPGETNHSGGEIVNLVTFSSRSCTAGRSAIVVPVLLTLIRELRHFTPAATKAGQMSGAWQMCRAVLTEPGVHFLPATWRAPHSSGHMLEMYELDMRLDQTYLRSPAVNSDEGAPWHRYLV